jgi:hypothetical protein
MWTEAKADLATWTVWPLWRKGHFAAGLVFLVSVLLFIGYFVFVEPVKFGFLVHRVKSAHTVDEEKSAFLLAHRCGRVWELHVSEGTNDWFDYKQLDDAIRDPSRKLTVEIEWLETSMWTGEPYRASRTLVENANLRVLLDGFSK